MGVVMRTCILIVALILAGCATQPIVQSEQLGRIQSLQNADNPHDQTEPEAIADIIIDPTFTDRLNLLCKSSVAELEAYDEDYEDLYAPEVALLPRSVYRQQGERPAYVLTQHMFEVIKLEADDGLQTNYWIVGVPKGFIFDGHSLRTWMYFIPGAAAFLNPVRDEINSSLIHDWLYAMGPQPGLGQDCAGYEYSGCRAFADDAYRDLLRKYRVDRSATGLVHWAVKQGGKQSFGQFEELRFYDKNKVDPERVKSGAKECYPDDRGKQACPVQPIILNDHASNERLRTTLRSRTVCKIDNAAR